MNEEAWINDMRRRIQQALNEAKRDTLRNEYGMLDEYTNPKMPPEVESECLDYLLEFERQFENAETITVRERIGNPLIVPLNELSAGMIEEAVEDLLDLLASHSIAVDFLGDFDAEMAYRYLTEELLDEEIDDIRIEGMRCVFTPSTPEYDIEMWVSDFVVSLFTHEPDYFLSNMDKQPHFDYEGKPVAVDDVRKKIQAVWDQYPEDGTSRVEPTMVKVAGDNGFVHADVAWQKDRSSAPIKVKSTFRLQPSPFGGWDIVQTSLLDDLLSAISGTNERRS